MKEILKGAYDLHVHTSPDVIPRKLDDEELVMRGKDAGMAGLVLKCHAAPTAGRAALMRKQYAGFDVIGSIALNNSVGGINPAAVETAGKMGARYVWFPTIDAIEYRKIQGKTTDGALTILTSDGSVAKPVIEVLELAKKYDMVVGTGHIGTEEALRLIDIAWDMGIKRICATHVTLPVCRMSDEQLAHAASKGAMLEYSYCHILSGKCTLDEVIRQIRNVGTEHVFLSSDLGQVANPYPEDGLLQFGQALLDRGIKKQELVQMLCENPKKLLYD